MAEVYLTLDLATKTGFALWEPGSSPKLGTFTMPSVNGQIGRSLNKFKGWLIPFMRTAGVTHVMYESAYLKPSTVKRDAKGNSKFVNGTSQDVARVLFAIGGYVEEVCYELELRCFECNVSSWRTHLIGNNPKRVDAHILTKQELQARGIPFNGQDQADAMGLMIYMAHKLKLEPDWPVGKHRDTVFARKAS